MRRGASADATARPGLIMHCWIPIAFWRGTAHDAIAQRLRSTTCAMCSKGSKDPVRVVRCVRHDEGKEDAADIAGTKSIDLQGFERLGDKFYSILQEHSSMVEYVSVAEAFCYVDRDRASAAPVRQFCRRLEEELGVHVHLGTGPDTLSAMQASSAAPRAVTGAETGARLAKGGFASYLRSGSASYLGIHVPLVRPPMDTIELATQLFALHEKLQSFSELGARKAQHSSGLVIPKVQHRPSSESVILKLCSCKGCSWHSMEAASSCPRFSHAIHGGLVLDGLKELLSSAHLGHRFQLSSVSGMAISWEYATHALEGEKPTRERKGVRAVAGERADADLATSTREAGKGIKRRRGDTPSGSVRGDDGDAVATREKPVEQPPPKQARPRQEPTRKKQSTILQQRALDKLQEAGLSLHVFKELPRNVQNDVLKDFDAGRLGELQGPAETEVEPPQAARRGELIAPRDTHVPVSAASKGDPHVTDESAATSVGRRGAQPDGPETTSAGLLFQSVGDVSLFRVQLKAWIEETAEPSAAHCQVWMGIISLALVPLDVSLDA
uniref:Uncharacterized protein n=1 Tax=Phaeomonas parva TaxID=124430 RepID=A0A7S1TQ04_9STRA